jgi:undecaprenyl-phosphate 4-deoxy-4-formamido-L-arabinose transferase
MSVAPGESVLSRTASMTGISTDAGAMQSKRVSSVSVVVPVYNSARVLPLLITRLEPTLHAIADEFELVCVNDGSCDELACPRRAAAPTSWIRAIDLMRNSGQHNALLVRHPAARYGITVTLDDDLQNPPEIPTLMAPSRMTLMSSTVRRIAKVRIVAKHRLAGFESRSPRRARRYARAWSARFAPSARTFGAFEEYRGVYVNIDVLLTWGPRFAAVRVDTMCGRSENRTTASERCSLTP